MRRLLIMIRSVGILLALLVVAAACSDSGEVNPSSPGAETTGIGGGGQGDDSSSATAVPGEYVPPSVSRDAQAKFPELLAAENAKPRFAGTINGFEIKPPVVNPEPVDVDCYATRHKDANVLAFGYFPPGTVALGPQTSGLCDDGTVVYVNQEFAYVYGSIGITLVYTPKVVHWSVSRDLVEAVTVHDAPGVLARPVMEEGNGYSSVGFDTDQGFVLIEVTELPTSELLKIAEGISCDGC